MESKPTGKKYSRKEAQNKFMGRLAEMVPRCWDDLVKLEVQGFPDSPEELEFILEWQRRWNLIEVPGILIHWMSEDGEIELPSFGENVPGKRALSRHVRANHEWGGRGGWITHQAKMTLLAARWNRDAGMPALCTFRTATEPFLAHDDLTSLLGDPALLTELHWDPSQESAEEARTRILNTMNGLLKTAMHTVEVNRGKLKTIPDRHFDHLIRCQVLEESQGSVAKSSGLARRRVLAYVSETADFIGLELRDGKEKAGRPRKPRYRSVRID